jgi:DNA-directed RNA polymerase subunit L
MNIKVLENEKNSLTFEVEGADHTFCNAFKEELASLPDVNIATYSINHPLVGVPKFFLKTIKDSPKKAIDAAIKNLRAKNQDFLKQYNSLK